MPYRYRTAAQTLRLLEAMIVRNEPVDRLARLTKIAQTSLRRMKTAFVRASGLLRLPDFPGRLTPGSFLERLAAQGAEAVRELFAGWKQLEPKHSILGLYAR